MVLSGHKHHRLVLGPHHIAQQVEQHGGFGVLSRQKEGRLRGEGPRGLALQAWGGEGPGEGREWSCTLSCSLSLASTSSRMSTGSVRPAVGTQGVGESLWGRPPRPQAESPLPYTPLVLFPQLTHRPGRTPPAFWAAWRRTGLSVGPQEDG